MAASFLLKEDGEQLLQETGDGLLVVVSADVTATPDAGAATLGGVTVTLGLTVGVLVAAATLAGLEPTLQIGADQDIPVASSAVILAGLAPNAYVQGPLVVAFNNYLFVTVGDGMSTGERIR